MRRPSNDGRGVTLDALRRGGKVALSRAIAMLESDLAGDATLAVLGEAWAAQEARAAHVVGLTGPPGVGKSTLTGALISAWRDSGKSVAVIAVDPSSPRSGGALLGDRARIAADPSDPGVFIRSMAARDRLGGLAAPAYPAMALLRALFDVVLLETVGVGQSETDVAGAADSVVLCIQPGGGDALQFMKAGIMEIPDLFVVGKADLGDMAERTRAELDSALALSAPSHDTNSWRPTVLSASGSRRTGIDAILDALRRHRAWLEAEGRLRRLRETQARSWVGVTLRDRFGTYGMERLGDEIDMAGGPFAALAACRARLESAR